MHQQCNHEVWQQSRSGCFLLLCYYCRMGLPRSNPFHGTFPSREEFQMTLKSVLKRRKKLSLASGILFRERGQLKSVLADGGNPQSWVTMMNIRGSTSWTGRDMIANYHKFIIKQINNFKHLYCKKK